MDDRNRRAPVALAAHAPVAQAPGGFLLAEIFGGQIGGDRVPWLALKFRPSYLAGVDRDAVQFVGVPVRPTLP